MVSYIKPRTKKTLHKVHFITFDYECVIKGEYYIPVAIALYDNNRLKVKNVYSVPPEAIVNNPEFDVEYYLVEKMLSTIISHYGGNHNKKKKNIFYLYAHNFSNFDSFFIAPVLKKLEEEHKGHTSCSNINDVLYELIYTDYDSNTVFHFRDSYHILPESLETLAHEALNEEKKHSNYENFTLENYNDIRLEIETQAFIDTYLLYNILIKVQSILNQYNMNITDSKTINGLAYSIYLSKFAKEKTIELLDETKEEFIRNGYYGGYVEVFEMENENKSLYCYDVNSLYPYIMSTKLLPTGESEWIQYKDQLYIPLTEDLFGFFLAIVKSGDKPFLLYKKEVDKSSENSTTIAPLGEWKGVFFSEELKYAQSLGFEVKIISGYKYKQKAILFKEFVEELFTKRQTSNQKFIKNYYKRLLNATYGKIGQRSKAKITQFDQGSFETFQRSACHISAAIASYGRIHMHKAMEQVRKQGKVFYTDTDSIFTDVKPEEITVEISGKLGSFKDVYGPIERAIFIGPKAYGLLVNGKEILKVKGFQTKYIRFNDLEGLLNNSNESKTYKHFEITHDKKGLKPGYTDKVLSISMNKRKVLGKNETEPFKIEPVYHKDGRDFVIEYKIK